MANPSCVLILGMHRSGTSLIARACSESGISAGPEDQLLEAQADNPLGFYENQHLVSLNDDLLQQAAGTWYAPPNIGEIDSTSAANKTRTFVEQQIESSIGQVETAYFLKDPRLCLTWEHWFSTLENPVLLAVYRSPIAVAKSLAARNAFPLLIGFDLWEFYNRRILAALKEYGGVLVSYDALQAGTQTLEEMLAQLAKLQVSCKPDLAAGLVSPTLMHHHSPSDDQAWDLMSESQRSLHDYMVDLSQADYGRGLRDSEPTTLKSESTLTLRLRDYASALSPLATLRETELERESALELAKVRTHERDYSLATLSRREKEYSSLITAHEREQQEHKKAAETLQALTQDHKALVQVHGEEVERFKDLLLKHDDLWDTLAIRGGELEESEEKAKFLFFSLTQAFATLLFFEQSTLAKLQRQFRRVYRLITGQRGKNSAYEDLLEHAHAHYAEFEIPPPEAPVTKLRMANDVVRYVFRNPAGSARSFSWARLRRAAQVFSRSSPEDLAVWVKSRFPGSEVQLEAFDPATLSPELDFLQLQFPSHAEPEVSIIIPVYNDYRVTMNCLQSVAQRTSSVAYEVILADDNSDDLTATISERVSGIRVVRSATNLRFLRNCNRAAEHARGSVLVFLNNDTAVTEGWLARLLEPFEDPTVGTAGPKLLFADGSLQEAGGIVWEDASGWNFGRGDDPEKPAYCYRKEVDYVSGACLAVRSELWTELAGFDERFAPAYYEDADLCFAARQRGYRCIYQPDSVVFHFEGVSNGTDLSSGIKQHQVTNQRVFRDKWSSLLASEHFPNAEHVVHARDRSKGRYSVLIIDHYIPHPDKDAGSRSTFMYIELLLALGCRVQFMGANFFPHEPYTSQLQAMGVEVLVGEYIARNLDGWLREHAPYIDEIFLHRPHVAEQFLPDLRKLPNRPPISFIGHDLHYLRLRRQAELTRDDSDFQESQRWERRELAVIDQVDKAYYFSQVELDELAQQVPAEKLRKIPLYATSVSEVPSYTPTQEQSLIFVGGYNHPPNVDAADWLVKDIMPALRERLDSPHLHLVGSNPPEAVQGLACSDVTVHGYLSDAELDQLYREAAIAVVPLRFGAGVKGKVIEAIAQGLPLVTTTIGAEGIPAAADVMWIAGNAKTFSDLICTILNSDEKRKEKLSRYQSWLEEHFSRRAASLALAADRPDLRQATEELLNRDR